MLQICQDHNLTWAWELETLGYPKLNPSYKLVILKHLCESQFDDNVKFKNVVNEEDEDAMRLQPIGRDRDGLAYWLQLDDDFNVRLYTEEQDDEASWRLV
uniref:WHIM1 domain-containing protein n=1 Tax=Petromyzon marinus TaxID=7757 RepID=S4RSC3_PETMA